MGFLTRVRKMKAKERAIKVLVLGLDNSGKSTLVKRFLGQPDAMKSVAPTLGFQIETRMFYPHCTAELNRENSICTYEQQMQIPSGAFVQEAGYQVHYWDVGGQATIRHFWRHYYEEGSDAFIWVIDGTDRERLWAEGRALLTSLLQQEQLEGATLLILVNKTDLPGCMSVSDVEKILLEEEEMCCSSKLSSNMSDHCLDNFEAPSISSSVSKAGVDGTLPSLSRLIKSHAYWVVGCSAVNGQNVMLGHDWLISSVIQKLYPS
jgi:ADP-ribosylation factor-like protein 2